MLGTCTESLDLGVSYARMPHCNHRHGRMHSSNPSNRSYFQQHHIAPDSVCPSMSSEQENPFLLDRLNK